MGLCPDACADYTLTPILNAACKLEERKRFIKRFGFYKCNITIPDPYDCDGLKAIMAPTAPATPGLVFSNELQGVTIAEPTKVARELSDYRPEYEQTVSRQITFNDRIAVDLDASGASSPYYDYDWWKNIYNLRNQLNILFLMDDDTLVIPRKPGILEGLPVQLDIFINQEKVQNGFIAEFKQGTLTFQGDPLLFNKPGISLSTCPDLAGLY